MEEGLATTRNPGPALERLCSRAASLEGRGDPSLVSSREKTVRTKPFAWLDPLRSSSGPDRCSHPSFAAHGLYARHKKVPSLHPASRCHRIILDPIPSVYREEILGHRTPLLLKRDPPSKLMERDQKLFLPDAKISHGPDGWRACGPTTTRRLRQPLALVHMQNQLVSATATCPPSRSGKKLPRYGT